MKKTRIQMREHQLVVTFLWKGDNELFLHSKCIFKTNHWEDIRDLFLRGGNIRENFREDVDGEPRIGDRLTDYSFHDLEGWSTINEQRGEVRHLSFLFVDEKRGKKRKGNDVNFSSSKKSRK